MSFLERRKDKLELEISKNNNKVINRENRSKIKRRIKRQKINRVLKKDDNYTSLDTTTNYREKGFYRSKDWLKLRFAVLVKYGRTCMLCRETEGPMHVDHIIPKSRAPQLALAMSNLQVLCRACNVGKGDSNDTDFRPK
jgi:5-methylcytosine-specific restriction endonuclease McrA